MTLIWSDFINSIYPIYTILENLDLWASAWYGWWKAASESDEKYIQDCFKYGQDAGKESLHSGLEDEGKIAELEDSL